jgi:hypothetical protein
MYIEHMLINQPKYPINDFKPSLSHKMIQTDSKTLMKG